MNPLRLLPRELRVHLGAGRAALLIVAWLVVAAVLLVGQTRFVRDGGSGGGAVAPGDATGGVSVRGAVKLQLGSPSEEGRETWTEDGDAFHVTHDGADTPVLSRADDGTLVHRAASTDDGFSIADAEGEPLHRFRARSDGESVVEDGAGATRFRVKIKEGKFNLYDDSGARLLHGKPKRGGIVVRDEQDADILFIEGEPDLAAAALLALPLPATVRALAFSSRALLLSR